MCPFWSWCFLKSMTKTDKKKALPLRPKQNELDPSDLSPNEKAPSIHPGDGFFKEGASCFHGGNLFLMGGHLKRGGSPWRSTNPSIQPFDRSKEDWNLAPSSENSWPDHNCWSQLLVQEKNLILFPRDLRTLRTGVPFLICIAKFQVHWA